MPGTVSVLPKLDFNLFFNTILLMISLFLNNKCGGQGFWKLACPSILRYFYMRCTIWAHVIDEENEP